MNFTCGQYIVFGFLNVHLLSPGGFFTFLIALAHGAPRHCRARMLTTVRARWAVLPRFFASLDIPLSRRLHSLGPCALGNGIFGLNKPFYQ